MKIIASYDRQAFPPLLSMYIHDAPHRRMHFRVIQQYREFIRDACTKAGIVTPIATPLDLNVMFVNPSSPDMGNIYLALEQAMDGKTLKGPGIVEDDGLIQKVTMVKFFNQPKKK
jgi:hypothetical protein